MARERDAAGIDRRRVMGVNRDLPPDAMESGRWENTPSGERVWRLLLQSQGAKAIRIHFTQFDVGAGSLWLFAPGEQERRAVVGPYSGKGLMGDGEFWSAAVFGDTAVVEYLPANGVEHVPFRIAGIVHRFAAPPGEAPPPSRSPGLGLAAQTSTLPPRLGPLAAAADRAALACQLDVSCHSLGTLAARAVAQIDFIDGGYEFICTAFLINTRSGSQAPYLLTANHCVFNQSIAATVNVYWNYQTPYCNAPSPSPPLPQTSGADYIAGSPTPPLYAPIDSAHLDVTLLRLRSAAPSNVYFLGWNMARQNSSTSLAVIGHPADSSGKEFKRVALGRVFGYPDWPAFRLEIISGLVEPGYSGAPVLLGSDQVTGLASAAYGFNTCHDSNRLFGPWFVDMYPVISPWLEDCTFSVTPTTINVPASGSSGNIDVVTGSGCSWGAYESLDWASLTNGVTRSGNGSVGYTVAANPGAQPRSGTLTVATRTVTVNQAGTASGPCATSVNPAATTIDAAGGVRAFYVTASAGCTWTVSAGCNWLPVPAGSGASGSGLFTLSVPPNGSAATRSCVLQSGGQTATITQAGTSTPPSIPAPATKGPFRFVAVTPCRIMDTRVDSGKTGPFGPPAFQVHETRSIPVVSSSCGVPAAARAYSLNITVVPAGPLGYLAAWPAGSGQPLVSTLNSFDGRIVANAAIVPAGADGAVSLFTTDRTDIVIDINGYFAP